MDMPKKQAEIDTINFVYFFLKSFVIHKKHKTWKELKIEKNYTNN